MEDSSDDDSYKSESDSSYGGRVRSNRGSVTQRKKKKRGQVQPKRRTYLKKKVPAYQKERFIEKAGALRANDVVLGRGPSVCSHEGNILFRFLCHLARPVYTSTVVDRRFKSDISRLIVMQMASLEPPGRFVESHNDSFSTMYLVPDGKVLEKTCQALRESKMACPPEFRGLARRLGETKTDEEKAELLASRTGIDLTTIKMVQCEMDSIIKKYGLSVAFMGNDPGVRSIDKDEKEDPEAEGLPVKERSEASRNASAPVPRGHGSRKAVVERILAIETGKKRAASKSASRKGPLKPKSVEGTKANAEGYVSSVTKAKAEGKVSSETKQIRRQAASKRGTEARQSSGAKTKPVKKRPVADVGDDPKAFSPKKRLGKSPRQLSSSKPNEETPEGVETPATKHLMPRKLPTKSSQAPKPAEKCLENSSEPTAGRGDEAFFTSPPSLTAFLSGVFSSGASAGNWQTPPRMTPGQGVQSGPAKKQEVGEASPLKTSTLSPKLASPMSGVYGPNHQEWLAAIAQAQECLSGTTMDAASLLPPQLSSILSGMFGDGIDLKNLNSVEEALELLPPTLANRLSCTLLTPMHSSFFANGGKPKEVPSPYGVSPGGFKRPPESTTMTANHGSTRGEAKLSAGTIVTGVSVTEWENDRVARLYEASPATVIEKPAGAVAGSTKAARSLLDDDGDDEIADAKVQAARRLSLGRDLFHHNDQPL